MKYQLCHITPTYIQVINGIMERPDWATAITTPIGMLPTGSGNALCASLLHEAGYVHTYGKMRVLKTLNS